MTGTNTFTQVHVQDFSGFCHKSFDLAQNWHIIEAEIQNGRPVYSLNARRRTFLVNVIPRAEVYVKVVNEDVDRKKSFISMLASSEARRYLHNYLLLKKYSIMCPQVLLVLEKRKWFTISESIIVTADFQGFEAWPQFFAAHSGRPDFDEIKKLILEEIAQFTAKLHAIGAYFSMDGRNLYLRGAFRRSGRNIGIIDLDHVKIEWFGKIPERRRLRNLARFERTLLKTAGMLSADYELFLEIYRARFEEELHYGRKE